MNKKKEQVDEPKNKWEEFAEREQEKIDTEVAQHEMDAADSLQSIDFNEYKKMSDQVTSLQREVEELQKKALLQQADMQNLRRRTERDVEEAHKFGTRKLLKDILPTVDSLVRALEGPEVDDPQIKNMREGILLTLEMLYKTLEKHGIVVIDPEQGEPFNPECHEAMSMVPNPELKSNSVIQVLQKGFELNGRVLRAAMVIVAA